MINVELGELVRRLEPQAAASPRHDRLRVARLTHLGCGNMGGVLLGSSP